MIILAMLMGSDYTEGIHNVGIITSMELLSKFKNDEIEENNIEKMKEFLNKIKEYIMDIKNEKKVNKKFDGMKNKFVLPNGFPNFNILNEYLFPNLILFNNDNNDNIDNNIDNKNIEKLDKGNLYIYKNLFKKK
jgi:DNA excision repair protein ERCC-5